MRPIFATFVRTDAPRYLYISMSPDEEGMLTVLIVRGGETQAGGPMFPDQQLTFRKVAPEYDARHFSMTLLDR